MLLTFWLAVVAEAVSAFVQTVTIAANVTIPTDCFQEPCLQSKEVGSSEDFEYLVLLAQSIEFDFAYTDSFAQELHQFVPLV